jgi:uncharacterized protein (DUF2336 family)
MQAMEPLLTDPVRAVRIEAARALAEPTAWRQPSSSGRCS